MAHKAIRLPLTNSNNVTLISDMSGKRVFELGIHWYLHTNGYVRADLWRNNCRVRIYLHRLVMGALPNETIDHINGNKLDNRLKNLRFCTDSENAANRKGPQSNNKSGALGVYYSKRYKHPWVARVQKKGETCWMRTFDTKEEAIKARDEKALEWFGAFAKLNKQ